MYTKKAFILTCAMMLSINITSFASEDRQKIDKVEIDIQYDIQDDSVSVYMSSDNEQYSVGDYEVINEPTSENGWGDYDVPRLQMYLSSSDDYYFNSTSKSYFKFEGDEVYFVKAERDEDKSELILTVDLVPINGDVGNPSDLKWSSKGNASWGKGYNARKYEVKVVRNDSTVNNEYLKTTGTSIDCLKYIGAVGNYKFKVRAINADDDKSEWIESYEWEVTSDILKTLDKTWNDTQSKDVTNGMESPGIAHGTKGWILDSTGWWYRNLDGKYTTNNWQLIDNKWYYFNASGYMMTGWIQLNNNWYYLGIDGSMKTGWNMVNNKWYYMMEDGHMLSNTKTPDGYKVDQSGAWNN